jgi:hypothetical protein
METCVTAEQPEECLAANAGTEAVQGSETYLMPYKVLLEKGADVPELLCSASTS